jgi:hypothetical protein
MTQPSTRPNEGSLTETRETIDEEWFATGERASSPPPRSTRRPMAPSSPPAEPAVPLGDAVADDWFR